MEINDVSYQPGGIFTFAHLRGVTNHLPKGLYKKALLDEGGADALIHHYLRNGGAQIDGWDAHNRLVNEGLFILLNLAVAGGTGIPNQMQLGTGSTGAWGATLANCRTVIGPGSAGLDQVIADSATQVDQDGITGNTLQVIEDFTAGGAFNPGPDEVMIKSATKALCYAVFAERILANTDHLIVTYKLKLVA